MWTILQFTQALAADRIQCANGGQPINTFYMYDAIGVWKTQAEIDAYSTAHNGTPVTFQGSTVKPGDIRYADIDNNGYIDANDKAYLGQPTPKYVFGMTNNFSYKNFDLSILLTATNRRLSILVFLAVLLTVRAWEC